MVAQLGVPAMAHRRGIGIGHTDLEVGDAAIGTRRWPRGIEPVMVQQPPLRLILAGQLLLRLRRPGEG